MNYYLYQSDSDTYHVLAPRPPTAPADLLRLRGEPIRDTWKPLAVRLELVNKPGDFPRFAGHIPVLSDRALTTLSPLVNDYVEVLPLNLEDTRFGDVHALHVLPVLDCLDPEKAIVKRFDDGTILSIRHYAFREEAIAGAPLFRIKGYEFSHCYVSDDFRRTVESAKLKGLVFRNLP